MSLYEFVAGRSPEPVLMPIIQRYSPGPPDLIKPDDEGEWVKWDDVKAKLDELDRLRVLFAKLDVLFRQNR